MERKRMLDLEKCDPTGRVEKGPSKGDRREMTD